MFLCCSSLSQRVHKTISNQIPASVYEKSILCIWEKENQQEKEAGRVTQDYCDSTVCQKINDGKQLKNVFKQFLKVPPCKKTTNLEVTVTSTTMPRVTIHWHLQSRILSFSFLVGKADRWRPIFKQNVQPLLMVWYADILYIQTGNFTLS